MIEGRLGGLLISKINFLSGRLFTRLLKSKKVKEINNAQGKILFVLNKKGQIAINDLGNELSLGKSTLTSMLDRLEEGGYINKEISTEDKRKILISLNKKSDDIVSEYEEVVKTMGNIYYKGFTNEEIVKFESYLKRVYSNLEYFNKDMK